ncbi:MAG: cytochrome c [Desertifilum sp. SIO1I2]|nr:cytochrome c [Desertifilum sp. SIO1I2]
MANQVTHSEVLFQRWLGILVAIAIAVGLIFWGISQIGHADPYIQSVLSLQGNEIQGSAIFQMNCAGCHGIEATGRVGPSLQGVSERKSRRHLIYQVISGDTPPMPQFQPSPQEMADLLSYLETL